MRRSESGRVGSGRVGSVTRSAKASTPFTIASDSDKRSKGFH